MFCLSGKGSHIECEIFPHIDVSDGEWEIGLVDLSTFNTIPNIEKDINDKFYYGEKEITIEEGSYEIDDLEKYIKDHLPTGGFILKPNNSTLKTLIKCSEDINFKKPNSIGKMLGFDEKIYKANVTHKSTNPINILKVNVIRVECNIARGSFQNGLESHVIHEFSPNQVPPGYKITETPSTVIYLPLNVQTLSNIAITLRDQDGNRVNLRNEELSLRLHIRKH